MFRTVIAVLGVWLIAALMATAIAIYVPHVGPGAALLLAGSALGATFWIFIE